MKDNEYKGIFEFITRHQLYLEGVKYWHHLDFVRYLKLLRTKITAILTATGVSQLDELSRRALNGLAAQITRQAGGVMTQYAEDILQDIRKLTRVDLGVQRAGFLSKLSKLDASSLSVSAMWKRVKNTIVPAFGGTIPEAAANLRGRTVDLIVQKVKTGYADAVAITDILREIIGDSEMVGGVLEKVGREARAFVSTSMQAASAAVTDAVGEIVSPCYIWLSIIDERTSNICQGRNGRIFRYGEGPLPPAHPHCRSRTMPWPCNDNDAPELPSFEETIRKQTGFILADLFGGKPSEMNAKIAAFSADDLRKFVKTANFKPRTVDEFEASVNNMAA